MRAGARRRGSRSARVVARCTHRGGGDLRAAARAEGDGGGRPGGGHADGLARAARRPREGGRRRAGGDDMTRDGGHRNLSVDASVGDQKSVARRRRGPRERGKSRCEPPNKRTAGRAGDVAFLAELAPASRVQPISARKNAENFRKSRDDSYPPKSTPGRQSGKNCAFSSISTPFFHVLPLEEIFFNTRGHKRCPGEIAMLRCQALRRPTSTMRYERAFEP